MNGDTGSVQLERKCHQDDAMVINLNSLLFLTFQLHVYIYILFSGHPHHFKEFMGRAGRYWRKFHVVSWMVSSLSMLFKFCVTNNKY